MFTSFQPLMKGLSTWFAPKRIVILIVAVLLCVALLYYSDSKTMSFEKMEDGSTASPATPTATGAPPTEGAALPAPMSSENSYTLSPTANPVDLLPKDVNSQWAQLNPAGSADFKNVNLLKAGHLIGIDTVGSTLRNANLQERSEPPNPTAAVSPWLNSTIEPDLMRLPLEIGTRGVSPQ